MTVKEILGLPVHPHFWKPLRLLKNLGPALLMRLKTLPPSFFCGTPRGIALRAAVFRHPETWRGCLFRGLHAIRFRLRQFLSSVEPHRHSLLFKPVSGGA